jgi:Pyruvate/2-oxoacid:ferredoxin oxidoreductase delta subunit
MQTGCPGVFAGGDMVPYARTVTTAVGHGKKAARAIDAWLRAVRPEPRDKPEIARFDMLRLWYHAEAGKRGQRTIDLERRRLTFDEVLGGLDPAAARYEAQRCLSCGNCFECDGCYSACPEQAVIKLGTGLRYEYDLDKCTGCAICYDQCPCGAITMIPEPATSEA